MLESLLNELVNKVSSFVQTNSGNLPSP